MTYEPKDLPSIKKFDNDIKSIILILKINKMLSKIGIGSKKLLELENDFHKNLEMKKELEMYPTKFNRYFNEDGWIVHDTLDFEVIKRVVNLYDNNEKEEAINLIKNFYSPENIEKRILYFKGIPVFQSRIKFIEYALEDYKNQKYYSCIPIILMTIDGIVNETLSKGFHSENIDLNVWDSITATETGIHKVKEIFQKSRKKTTTEPIKYPYRHGILHGRDLSYDNYEVAVRSWAFLFVVRDWILSKRSENKRFNEYQEKNKVKSWKEIFKEISELEKTKKAISDWEPRNITNKYLNYINSDNIYIEDSPEKVVIEFLSFWKNKNYGGMAQLFSDLINHNPKTFVRDIRIEYENFKLFDYKIVKIKDEAPSISEIFVEIKVLFREHKNTNIKFRCIYEKSKYEAVPRNLNSGMWKIVTIDYHSIYG